MPKPIVADPRNTGPGRNCVERNITCTKNKDFVCCPTIKPVERKPFPRSKGAW